MKRRRFHLGFLLIAYTIISLVIGLGTFTAASMGGGYIVESRIFTVDYIQSIEQQLLDEYIAYLNEHSRSIESRDAGMRWLNGRQNIMLAVYNGGKPFGDDDSGVILISASQDAPAMYELLQNEYAEYWYSCPIMMIGDKGRTKLVRVLYYPMYSARRIILFSSVGLGFGAFVLALLLFIRGKTKYIVYLSGHLSMMEGGELNVPLKLKGSDELTSLAENMDRMRLSFIERLTREEEMDRSSKELMTAMSHDLRTPLTALMGYLEILDSGAAADEERKREYIASALRRARQLKGMTDELFEYFLVYSAGDTAPELERMDAATLFGQLWDESGFSLESEGFTLENAIGNESVEIAANPRLLGRVIDNIISNIRKYADRSGAVKFEAYSENGWYVVSITNKTGTVNKAESSGIGLMSCRKVLAAHGGSFETKAEDGCFTCIIRIPAAEKGQA